jgi:NADH:ubiquinone oxidoreductase subunit K
MTVLASPATLWVMFAVTAALAVAGLYCLLVSRNLIRVLIGVELLIKALTVLLVLFGFVTGRTALAQSLVITLIVIEVFFITIACGVVLSLYRHTQTLDTKSLTDRP